MVEVFKNIFMVEIPLTGNPLKYLNCYIIKTKKGNLIIDTGFNNDECKDALMNALNELEINLDDTSLFLTHLHSDHTGLAGYFHNKNVKIYINEKDAKTLNDSVEKEGPFWQRTFEIAKVQDLDQENLCIEQHPGFKNRPVEYIEYIHIEDGENLKIGEFNFEAVLLEGHTPGITGLYDKHHKIMFCADHILAKITPNITFSGWENGDMLGKYFKNLDKVYEMDIKFLFSSHRQLIENHRSRIIEIKKHHELRLSEIKNILKTHGISTVRNVTKNMHWDITARTWDEFPNSQKWFAAGEAHAHLERLKALGEVGLELKDGLAYYYII